MVSGVALLVAATCSLASVAARAADPWTQIGLTLGRPRPLDPHVERRLWLLDAMAQAQLDWKHAAMQFFGPLDGPSVTVGLVLDDGLFYSEGFGYVDSRVPFPGAVPVNDTTIYEVGSLTKVYTGTGLLTMIDNPQGRLNPTAPMSLDDSVTAKGYFPALEDVCIGGVACLRPPFIGANSNITLRHLVSHSAGLADVILIPPSVDPNTTEAVFVNQEIPNTFILFNAGDRSAYSGIGTAIVGLIIKKLSREQSYAAYMTNHLLLPLGMTHSVFDDKLVPPGKLALKFDYVNFGYVAHPALDAIPPNNATVLVPTAALFTSVHDHARFLQMWLTQTAPVDSAAHAIVSRQSLAMGTKPVIHQATITPNPAVDQRCGGFTAMSGIYESAYSGCTPNDRFGVNWIMGPPFDTSVAPFTSSGPYVSHSGGLGQWESQTMLNLDPGHLMGGTSLVSVDAVPVGRSTSAGVSTINALMRDALQRDLIATKPDATGNAPSWQNQPLAIGTARLLWMLNSGSEAGDQRAAILAQFSPLAQQRLGLTLATVANEVPRLRGPVTALCDTFRVQGFAATARGTSISLKMRCGTQALDETLTVSTVAPYLLEDAQRSSATSIDPY